MHTTQKILLALVCDESEDGGNVQLTHASVQMRRTIFLEVNRNDDEKETPQQMQIERASRSPVGACRRLRLRAVTCATELTKGRHHRLPWCLCGRVCLCRHVCLCADTFACLCVCTEACGATQRAYGTRLNLSWRWCRRVCLCV